MKYFENIITISIKFSIYLSDSSSLPLGIFTPLSFFQTRIHTFLHQNHVLGSSHSAP